MEHQEIGLTGRGERISLSFLACIVYFFFEYMRLQEKYAIFYGLSLGKVSAIIFLIAFFLDGNTFSYRNRINKYIIAFSIWMILTAITGINLNESIDRLTDILKFFLIYFLAINVINNRRQLYILIVTLLLLYLSYTNFSLRQWAAQGFYSGIHGTFVGSGFFNNANDMGAALCAFWGVSLGMAFADKKVLFGFFKMKWFHILNTLAFVLSILITSARGATLGLAGSAVYAAFKSRKRVLWSVTLVITSIIYMGLISPQQWERFRTMGDVEDKTAQERIENWKAALDMFQDYPITGVGVGNYVEANNRIYHTGIPYVQHNIYLQALTETGLPGLAIVILMIIGFFKNQMETKKILESEKIDDPFYKGLANGLNISMIGFLIAGFFITVLFYPFFWVNLTISVALKKIVEKKVSPQVA
ncbi:MAG: O-antigen ligase family protein [Thermodesulfobacteriota bacterium]